MDDLGSNPGTWELPAGFDAGSRASRLVDVGVKYHLEGNTDAARMHYDAALLLEPDHPVALADLSGILFHANQDHAAVSVARRAIKAAPDNVFAKANYGAALLHLGRFAQAQRELEPVLRTYPNDPGIWHNLSLAYYMSGDISRALKAMRKSLDAGPATENRVSDFAIFTLASGDIKTGLEDYEIRWKSLYKSRAWTIGVPEWQGEDLNGKHLLLHHEQGLGDGIMLCRFIRNLEALGAKVSVSCPESLRRLIEANFNVATFEWNEDFGADFDFHSPMLSALRWLGLGTKYISPKPYLSVKPWNESLGASGRLAIGICWESGDHSPELTRRRRIIPLEKFFPLTEFSGVRLVSLQKGEAQKDIINKGAESFVFDPMSRAEDFYNTASIVNRLDLVISVDSAVAHVSGALGKPTLMLGPFTRCWRWWGEVTGLPWYEDFRIYKQESYNSWDEALRRVYKDVEARLR